MTVRMAGVDRSTRGQEWKMNLCVCVCVCVCVSILLSPHYLQCAVSVPLSAKPRNSASPVTVVAGDKPVTVARCESVNGRPAAQIRWETVVNGNATTLATQESDKHVTIRSEYKLRPTPADNDNNIAR